MSYIVKSGVPLSPDDARAVLRILGSRVLEQDAAMSVAGWRYLSENSNIDTWTQSKVFCQGKQYNLKAENIDCIKAWAANKFAAGTRYEVHIVTTVKIHDGVVLRCEKQ